MIVVLVVGDLLYCLVLFCVVLCGLRVAWCWCFIGMMMAVVVLVILAADVWLCLL